MRLPKSWHQITLRQYNRIAEIIATYTDPIDRDIMLISYLAGVHPDKVTFELTMKEKWRALQDIKFIADPDSMPTKLPKKFRHQGKRYKVMTHFRDMTAGQYADIMTFAKEGPESIHKVLAVVCLQREWLNKPKYDGQRHAEISEAFMDLPMSIAYPIQVFFCNLWNNLTRAIPDYLKTQLTMMENELNEMNIMTTTNG